MIARPVDVLYDDLTYYAAFLKMFKNHPTNVGPLLQRAFLHKLESTLRFDRTFQRPIIKIHKDTEDVIKTLLDICIELIRPPFQLHIVVDEEVISFGVLVTAYEYLADITQRAHVLARMLLT